MEPRDGANQADMPQFLAALDKTVALLSRLQSGNPHREDISEAINAHLDTLHVFAEMTRRRLKFNASARAKGDALTNLMQQMFGRSSSVTQHAKQMAEGVPRMDKRDIGVLEGLQSQVARLERLRLELPQQDDLRQVVNLQVGLLQELPRLFPEGAPVRLTLEKRIARLS